jgi:hypothetical protein
VYFWIYKKNRADLESGWDKTKQVLLTDLRSGDERKEHTALYVFVSLGKIEIIPHLIGILNTPYASLNKRYTKEKLETYLNCGSRELAEAAESWAVAHGYAVFRSPGSPKMVWGRW